MIPQIQDKWIGRMDIASRDYGRYGAIRHRLLRHLMDRITLNRKVCNRVDLGTYLMNNMHNNTIMRGFRPSHYTRVLSLTD